MQRLAFLLILLSMAACNVHQPTPVDTLVIGIDNFPKQFDPRLSGEAISAKFNKLIYSGLLARDARMDLIPDLVEKFSNTDATTYVFTLKKNITFHNGQPLTSEDVRTTYKTILDGQLRAPGIAIRDIIDSIEAPDPLTVIFHLKKPYAPFTSLMTIGILPANIAAKKIDAEGKSAALEKYQDYGFVVGTGPFRLASANLDAGMITLDRHDHYHGQKARAEHLVFRVIRDGTLRTMELMKGRLDLVQNAIPFAMIPVLQNSSNLQFISQPGINFGYMAFNLKIPVLQNRDVRQAMALAIDRDRIIKYKLEGLAVKATSILSPAHMAFNPDLKTFSFDPALARTLLDKAGLTDPDGDGPLPRFVVTYKTSTDRERIEIAHLIAENLRQIGVGVEIKSYEFGTFYRDIKQGDFDVFTLSWVGFADADGYYDKFHSSQFPPAGNNRGYYSNPKLDVLLEKSRLEENTSRRNSLYKDIQKIVYDDFVYAPLWYETNFVFMGKNVKDYELRPDAGFQGLVGARKE